MAWIESHQELGRHPKTRKLARLLGISLPQAVGHLHYLWWWALDFAQSGDLTRYDDADIADGALWEGDPAAFVAALTDAGFLDPDRTLHDWNDYAGKLIEKRRADAERKRKSAGRHPDIHRNSDGTLPELHRNSTGTPPEVAGNSNSTYTVPNHTLPNQESKETDITLLQPPEHEEPDHKSKTTEYPADFEEFWAAYPRKIGKKPAYDKWRARLRSGVTPAELIKAAEHYAAVCAQDGREQRYIMHPETFLGPNERWKDFLAPPPPPTPRVTRIPPRQREPTGLAALMRLTFDDGGDSHDQE